MITIQFFEDITLYHYIILDAGTKNDILYTRVIIDGKISYYYQTTDVIIIRDIFLGSLYEIHSVIPIKKHLELLTITMMNQYICVKVHNRNLDKGEYEFVDITRTLKLKKLLENDRYRYTTTTHN